MAKDIHLGKNALSRFNVSLTDDKIVLVETQDWVRFLGWQPKDLAEFGHEVKRIRVSQKGLLEKREVLKHIPFMGDRQIRVVKETKIVLQFPETDVRINTNFDKALATIEQDPEIPFTENTPFFVAAMFTVKDDMTFTWKKIKMTSETGRSVAKLILTHLNGVLLSQLKDEIKEDILNIVGPISKQQLCKVNDGTGDVTVLCGGYES